MVLKGQKNITNDKHGNSTTFFNGMNEFLITFISSKGIDVDRNNTKLKNEGRN